MKRNVLGLDVEETIAKKEKAKEREMKKQKKRANPKKNLNPRKNQLVKASEVVEAVAIAVVATVVVAIAVVVIVVEIEVVVEGEEEVGVVEKRGKKGRGKKIRVATIHGEAKIQVTDLTKVRTETPNQLVQRPEINSRKEKSRELQRLLDRKERMVSLKVKGRLSVVEEVAAEAAVEEVVVEEAAEAAVMVQCQVTLPTRQSKPKIDNSEDPTIQTGVEQSEVTP